jgi:hypothetical protein
MNAGPTQKIFELHMRSKNILLSALILLTCAPCAVFADGSAQYYNPETDSTFQLPNDLTFEPAPSNPERSSDPFGAGVADIMQGAQHMSTPFAQAGSFLSAWQSWRESNDALSDLDRELDRDMQDDGEGPDVPSSCADKPDCNTCFAAAYRELNFTRMTLERLRSIHTRTIAYIKAKESFGDTVSPVHGISGLSWQYAKADIEKARASFNKTSLDKYEQLIGNMRRSIEMVAACERDHFDNPDWDDRYGFMYLQAVKTAYKPTE